MKDDDDDLIVLDKSPNLPSLKQIDNVVRKVVSEAKDNGISVSEVKLRECIEVIFRSY